jgi:phosphatidylglycerol:prolipoprotein diacylglycerol transferase
MLAVLVSAAVAAIATSGGLPYIHLETIKIPIPGIGHLPLEPFGIIVACGVMIGAEISTRYARRRGVDEDDVRSLIGWVIISGFIGAHLFDTFFYELDELKRDPLRLVKIWAGISSYGGLIGGAIGWLIFLKRHPGRWSALFADICVVGFVPGFTIGRIGCSVVSDHVGSATDFVLGVDYPASFAVKHGFTEATRMHNLGFYEFLYLVPVSILVLWLGFRRPRLPVAFLAVLVGALYAPVRFYLDFLRYEDSDPRYFHLTPAQWVSIAVFVAAAIAAVVVLRKGRVAPLAAELGGRRGGYRDPDKAPLVAGPAAAKKPVAKK